MPELPPKLPEPPRSTLEMKPAEGIYKRRLTRAGGFWVVWGVAKVVVSIAQKG